MSVDLRGSHSLPCKDEAANSGDSSPMPEVHGPEENGCSQAAAEMLQKEIGKKFNPGRCKLIRREGRSSEGLRPFFLSIIVPKQVSLSTSGHPSLRFYW